MKEKFKQLRINGINTDYIISNYGRVFTKNGKRQKCTELNHFGYEKVAIQINKKPKLISVHRAVYESFIGDIPKGMQINHKDGNKQNNRITNLEVTTPRENVMHAWNTGLNTHQYRVGICNPNAKHDEGDAIAVYSLLANTKWSHKRIANKLGLDLRFVENISKGLWADITGFNKDDIRRNHKFSEEEELGIWFMYQRGYRTKDITKLTGIDKDCINNKLTYLRRNKSEEMNEKLQDPKNMEMVKKFLDNLLMFSVEFL